jgi:hypothetical protein
MMQNHIFLISDSEYDLIFVRELATIFQAKFAGSSRSEGIDGLTDTEKLIAIFINADSISQLDTFQERLGGVFPSKKVHCIISQDKRAIAQEIVDYQDIGNIIIRNASDSQEIQICARHYARVLKSANSSSLQCLSGLCNEGAQITTKELSESLQKRFVVEAINSQLAKRKWHPKAANSISTAVDEMIMNAIFDAPMDSSGRQKHETTPRSANLIFEDTTKVLVEIAFDEHYFAATVTDSHGTLKRSTALKHVTKAFSATQDIRRPEYLEGAGLGLALILRSGGSLHFSCKPGQQTKVTAIFSKADNYVKFRNQFQFISTVFES